MSNLMKTKLKTAFDRFRDDLHDTMSRWLPVRRHEEQFPDARFFRPFDFSMPAVDVAETDSEIKITAELPGMDPRDFEVELHGNRLVLKGEKRTETEEKKKDTYYSECRYGSFSRTIDLPCEVKSESIEANYANGVLKVVLPKTEEAKARKVKIQVK